MQTVAGFTYWEIQFTGEGEPDASDQRALVEEFDAQNVTDLVVIAHGWRNDVDDARALYRELLGNMRLRLDAGHPAGGDERTFAVAAVLWPSLVFAENDELPHAAQGKAAAAGANTDVPAALLALKLDQLADELGIEGHPELDKAREAAAQLGEPVPAGVDPRAQFVASLRAILPPSSDASDDASDRLFTASPDLLLNRLEPPIRIVDARREGGAASMGVFGISSSGQPQGGGAGLGGLFNGVRTAAWQLLNYATYYIMKERAAKIGTGLDALLSEIRRGHPDLRIHLIGHSFGARLVTAAAAGPSRIAPSSLSLLQAAYSHNALGPGSPVDGIPTGFFRVVMTEQRVRGPIMATFTQNDQAVGIAYAIASRLSGDVAAAFGGPDDKFGGLGRSGAVRMAENETIAGVLQNGNFVYDPWPDGKVVNLLADAFIKNHGDVRNVAAANAVLNAFRL